MQSLRKRLSFRKKKDHVPECSKPHQWQEDEKKVREGTCSFQVRYLGYIEVFDSRGMHICEEAVKTLKAQCKGKYQRAVLYVSGDALRVVDEISKSMIVDQTIEKVSFCAPDRNHEKGFAYICRDGTTRRWMCHGFLAVKESGERLSHAVGCAFAICLEKKQKRDKETGVTVTYNQSRTCFERTGSFRQTTLTERIVDPQSAILAEPVPVRTTNNPFALQRPHATANLLERQGSFRGFEKLQETSSPFKRTLSLRLNDLPSTLQRQSAITESPTHNGNGASIPEVSQEQEDSIAQMCQQLTQGLTALTTEDPFSGVPNQGGARNHTLTHQASLPTPFHNHAMLTRQQTMPAAQNIQPSNQIVTNPWAGNNSSQFPTSNWGAASATVSSASNYNPFATTAPAFPESATLNGSQRSYPQPLRGSVAQPQQQQQLAFAHARSHSIDTGEMASLHWQHSSNLRKPVSTQNGALSSTPSIGISNSNPWPTSTPPVQPTSTQGPGVDPFDVAWAAKSVNKSNSNPFGSKSVKQFEVQL